MGKKEVFGTKESTALKNEKKTVSGTKEWAATNFDVMRGCVNGCLYCYACANSPRVNRDKTTSWTTEEVNEKKVNAQFGKRQGTIMYPTAHDFTMENLKHTLPPLIRMLEAGNDVLVVSKPRLPVIWEICEACEKFKDQVLFRFTIGSGLEEILKFWEPNAPGFMSRLESLGFAFGAGFKTSVSMEPLLDVDEDVVLAAVSALEEYVTDAIWIGKVNHLVDRLKRNGYWDDPGQDEVRARANELLASQTDPRIWSLYEKLKDHPKIKWKESIKRVVGLEIPTEAGLDI
jgi:DNA repair photolyase